MSYINENNNLFVKLKRKVYGLFSKKYDGPLSDDVVYEDNTSSNGILLNPGTLNTSVEYSGTDHTLVSIATLTGNNPGSAGTWDGNGTTRWTTVLKTELL